MASLESIRQKGTHSKLHLDLANAETRRYLDGNPGEIVPNPDGDPDRPTFIYREKVPVPPKISLMIGDCLQNLRSTFDYLIWELVLAANNVPTKKNAFPVCLTPSAFKDAKRGDRLKGIPAEAETLVESLQPYTHSDPSDHWLAILDELTNINKHRRIFVATLSGFSMSGMLAELDKIVEWGDPNTMIDHRKTGNILTAEQVQMQDDFVPFVAFDEGAVKGMEIGLLAETYIGIVAQALDGFERFFV